MKRTETTTRHFGRLPRGVWSRLRLAEWLRTYGLLTPRLGLWLQTEWPGLTSEGGAEHSAA